MLADDDVMKIILDVPKNMFYFSGEAKVYDGDDIKTYKLSLTPEGIREARGDYLYLDPDDDAFVTYTLTDKGMELAKALEAYNEV